MTPSPIAYRSAVNRLPAQGRMPRWKLRALERRQERRKRHRGEALPQLDLQPPPPAPRLKEPMVVVKHQPGTVLEGPYHCDFGHWAMRYAANGLCTVCSKERAQSAWDRKRARLKAAGIGRNAPERKGGDDPPIAAPRSPQYAASDEPS